MSSQGWPCADVACRSNCINLRNMIASMSSRHEEHHTLETMIRSSTYRASATCSARRRLSGINEAVSGVGRRVVGPGGFAGSQDHAAAGRAMGSSDGKSLRSDPDGVTNGDRALGEGHVQALAEFTAGKQDSAVWVAPPQPDEEGGTSRAFAHSDARVAAARGPGDEGSQAVSDPARGNLLIHLGSVSDDDGGAGHVGFAPGTVNCARGLPFCSRPITDSGRRERRLCSWVQPPPF